VGECASVSVHGANRLGGNALMETITYGRRTGEAAGKLSKTKKQIPISNACLKNEQDRIDAIRLSTKGERVGAVWKEIGAMMSDHFGIVRERSRMNAGKEKLLGMLPRCVPLALDDHSHVFNMELIEALQLQCVADLARVIAVSALNREESRGAHFRSDFPERDDTKWLKHTLAYCDGAYRDGLGVRLDYRSVSITTIPPAKRVY
jgi:succinate dehydrogenase / fumarate reductase flavoprotein subunit